MESLLSECINGHLRDLLKVDEERNDQHRCLGDMVFLSKAYDVTDRHNCSL